MPMKPINAKNVYMIPGAVGETFCAIIVATIGLKPDAVECAMSYPSETLVRRTLGGNLSPDIFY
jgi:hypothetical protein